MPQAGAKPMTATNPCSLDTRSEPQKSSRLAPVFLVPPEFCSTKALKMAATENSRGKQKEWVFLSVFYDWEFNYNTKKKSSRFILPLCLKKKKKEKSLFF